LNKKNKYNNYTFFFIFFLFTLATLTLVFGRRPRRLVDHVRKPYFPYRNTKFWQKSVGQSNLVDVVSCFGINLTKNGEQIARVAEAQVSKVVHDRFQMLYRTMVHVLLFLVFFFLPRYFFSTCGNQQHNAPNIFEFVYCTPCRSKYMVFILFVV